VFLVTVSHWIQKFRAFEEYKARNDKSEWCILINLNS
jgi:hypothetical protein